MIKKLILDFACLIWAVFCRGDVNNIDSSEAKVVEGTGYEWVFVYYIALDNNLSMWGQKVLGELERGIVNSKVAVVVQADFGDTGGMRRITMRRVDREVQREEIVLDSEDSADEGELRKYFEWVEKKWDAENYAVIFPNHGGRLNQMCRDDHPFKNRDDNKQFVSGKWLRSSEAGKIAVDFNEQTGGKVRLLFLQQCGRASVQNLCNFVDSADYIMASPTSVGAPNTYYTAMVTSAAENGDIGGDALAQTIMAEDNDYLVYTLVNNSELKRLPEKLKAALKAFREVSVLDAPGRCLRMFGFAGESYYDLKSYLQALDSANNDVGGEELVRFLEWYEGDVVVQKSFRNVKEAAGASCSGLSIYIPSGQNELEGYSFLPFYKQTGLDSTVLIGPPTGLDSTVSIGPPSRGKVMLRPGRTAVKKSVPRLLAIIGVAGVVLISLVCFLLYIFHKAWKISEMVRFEVGRRDDVGQKTDDRERSRDVRG